jgi:hypothetical protein
MDLLKLVALDAEDLLVVSAHVQDAVSKVSELEYLPGEKRFVVAMNRFVWENAGGIFRRHKERRRAVLHFDRVLSVKTSGIDRNRREDVLSLLALRFRPAEAPAGAIELIFAGGAAASLEVECVEARLTDLGAAWEARSLPRHPI